MSFPKALNNWHLRDKERLMETDIINSQKAASGKAGIDDACFYDFWSLSFHHTCREPPLSVFIRIGDLT